MARCPLPLIRPPELPGGGLPVAALMARWVRERHRRRQLPPWRALAVLLFQPKPHDPRRPSGPRTIRTTQLFNLRLAVHPVLALIRERWTRIQPMPAMILPQGRVLSSAPLPLPVIAASRDLAPKPAPLPPVPKPVLAARGQPQRSSDPSRPAAPPAPRIDRPLPTVPLVVAAPSAIRPEPETLPQAPPAPERAPPLATSLADTPSGTPLLASPKVIETLTETVLRRIDRRLLSERERRERWP